jgi:hypothetical protein
LFRKENFIPMRKQKLMFLKLKNILKTETLYIIVSNWVIAQFQETLAMETECPGNDISWFVHLRETWL